MTTQTDFWPDGVYDNHATGRREVWKDGRLCRYAMRNCCGDTDTSWSVLRRKWGEFPDYPSNQRSSA